MTMRTLKNCGSFAFVILLAGCLQREVPPAPPPAVPVQQVAVVEPPRLAPKCEKLEEGCVASNGIKARIKQSGYAFEPPVGWAFAQEEALTIASTKTAGMAVTIQDIADPKKEAQSRQAAVDMLMARIGVTPPKKKLALPKKPGDVLDLGSMKVSLWEVDKASRSDAKGALLVFWAKPSDKQGITGAGFVSDADATSAEAIIKAVKSIGTVP
jgi:hypothetical protein